jgi:hypothetical protein
MCRGPLVVNLCLQRQGLVFTHKQACDYHETLFMYYFHFKNEECVTVTKFDSITLKRLKIFCLRLGWSTEEYLGRKWSIVQKSMGTPNVCNFSPLEILFKRLTNCNKIWYEYFPIRRYIINI